MGLPYLERRHIVGCQRVEEVLRPLALKIEHAHVRYVEQPGAGARGTVLGAHRGIPHGHIPPGERHHLGAQLFVQRVQRGCLERPVFRLDPLEGRQRAAHRSARPAADVVRLAGVDPHSVRVPVDAILADVRFVGQHADAHRARDFGVDVVRIEGDETIRQIAQPHRNEIGILLDMQQVRAVVEAVQHAPRQELPGRIEQSGGLEIAITQRQHVAGHHCIQETGWVRPVDIQCGPAAPLRRCLRQDAEMLLDHVVLFGITSQVRHGDIDACAAPQPLHFAPGRVQHVEIDLGAPRLPRAAATVTEGLAAEQHIGHDIRQPVDLRLAEAALRDPRRAQPDARGAEGRFIARNRVPVADDPSQVEDARGRIAAERGAVLAGHGLTIDQQHMAFGAAMRDAQPARSQPVRQPLGIGHDLELQRSELIGARQLERHRHRGDRVHVRSALLAGEHRAVELAPQLRIGGHQHRAARPGHRLVRGEADDVSIPHGSREDARRHQAGHVRDIGQQIRAHLVGDGAEFRPVGRIGVGREPGNDDLGPGVERLLPDRVVVQVIGLFVDVVAGNVVDQPAPVNRAAMRQMAAVQQVESHDGVARLEQRAIYGVIGRGAA